MQHAGLIINEDVESEEGKQKIFAVVFNIDDEKLHYLNETALFLLKQCETPLTMEEIECNTSKIYRLDENNLKKVQETVQKLVDIGLIECDEGEILTN